MGTNRQTPNGRRAVRDAVLARKEPPVREGGDVIEDDS